MEPTSNYQEIQIAFPVQPNQIQQETPPPHPSVEAVFNQPNLLAHVLSFVNPEDLNGAKLVNRAWKAAAEDTSDGSRLALVLLNPKIEDFEHPALLRMASNPHTEQRSNLLLALTNKSDNKVVEALLSNSAISSEQKSKALLLALEELDAENFCKIFSDPSVDHTVITLDFVRKALKQIDREVSRSEDAGQRMNRTGIESLEKILALMIANNVIDPAFDNSKLVRWAAKHDCPRLLEQLFVSTNIDPTAKENKAMKYALFSCLKNGDIKTFYILAKHPKVNLAISISTNTRIPFLDFFKNGTERLIAWLDGNPITSLFCSVLCNDNELFDACITANEALPNALDRLRPALFLAVEQNDTTKTRRLLESDIIETIDWNVIQYAVYFGKKEVLELLLTHPKMDPESYIVVLSYCFGRFLDYIKEKTILEKEILEVVLNLPLTSEHYRTLLTSIINHDIDAENFILAITEHPNFIAPDDIHLIREIGKLYPSPKLLQRLAPYMGF